jgi:hypothetical protein
MILVRGLDSYFLEYSLILVCHEQGSKVSGSLYGEHFLDRLNGSYFSEKILIRVGIFIFD